MNRGELKAVLQGDYQDSYPVKVVLRGPEDEITYDLAAVRVMDGVVYLDVDVDLGGDDKP